MHHTSNMPYSSSAVLFAILQKKKNMQRHGSAITCVYKVGDYCKIACICSTWNCFFFSFRLKSLLSSPCMWPVSHRRPSLAQQHQEKGIRIDSPWCKLECFSPITSPSRSSNETSHWDTSNWISICVSLAVSGYCLSKHWFVLLSLFLLFNTCWGLVKRKQKLLY